MRYIKLFEDYSKDTIVLYHGTSDVFYDDIITNGLKNPYLAANYELAEYYAYESVDENGGDIIVFSITLSSDDNLRIDYNALDEPVYADGNGGDEEDVQEMYDKIEDEHPEWV